MQGAICGWSPYNYYVRMLSPAYVVPARLHGYGHKLEVSNLGRPGTEAMEQVLVPGPSSYRLDNPAPAGELQFASN